MISRRRFIGNLSASAAGVAAVWASEMRFAQAAAPWTVADDAPSTSTATARILFNENPLGPSPKALEALRTGLSAGNLYPFTQISRLEMKLRALHGLATTDVPAVPTLGARLQAGGDADLVLGVGSSELLKAVARAFAAGKENVVESHPSYTGVGAEAAGMPGATARRIMVPLDANGRNDLQRMKDAVTPGTGIVILCNPNNPTGTALKRDDVKWLADQLPENVLLFVDEAYVEYLDNPADYSVVDLAKSRPNVLITRTFSKLYGLAGLRIGYGIGHRGVIRRLEPHTIGQMGSNIAALLAAEAALEDKQHQQSALALRKRTLDRWKKEFPELGFKMAPTEVAFCWADLGKNARPFVNFLAERQIQVSHGSRWNLPNCVRISMGTDTEMERLSAAAKAYRDATG
jgi:histidinol-phosphate aminotransferase